MPGDTLSKIGDSMGRAITKLSVKTSSSIEKSKIKIHIESLTGDVQNMLLDVGEAVYDLWAEGETSTESLAEKLEEVRLKKDEIRNLSDQLESIDDRDNEIFGKKSEAAQKAEGEDGQNQCCPNCGSPHDPEAKFCRRCGTKLS